MANRDFSHRICIDKALVPVLKQQGQQLLYDDLAGIVNHILRLHLTGHTPITARITDTVTDNVGQVEPNEHFYDGVDISLA
jgi:hypothetical protein